MENDSWTKKIVVLFEILLLFSLQYSTNETLLSYIVPTNLSIANSFQT